MRKGGRVSAGVTERGAVPMGAGREMERDASQL